MKKLLAGITLCVILVLCLGSSASAALVNKWYGGDRVAYDGYKGTYWCPNSTNKMTGWEFASQDQLVDLRWSFAGIARNIVEYAFPGTPVGESRTAFSPYMAWPVQPHKPSTPTDVMTHPFFGGAWETMPNLASSGRADEGFGWRQNPDNGVTLPNGEADGRFMVRSLVTSDICGGELATMMFNQDVHHLPDDASESQFLFGEPVGAWIISDAQLIPAPGTLLLASMGVGLVGYLRRRRTL